METLQGVPAVLVVPLAVPAVPALVLALLAGAILSLLGLSAATLPPLLLARGDVLFFASASLVAVVAARAGRRVESPSR